MENQYHPQDLEQLAQRAKLRRMQLKQKIREIAALIDVKKHNFVNWESRLPVKPKLEQENRWEDALQVPRGWLRDARIPTPKYVEDTPQPVTISSPDATCVSDEIRAIAAWLARAAIRKRTADYRALSPSEKRLADMFSIRYGVEGENATPLQAVGDRYGLTRERIRQVVAKMLDRTSTIYPATPWLDKLAADIRPHLPAVVEQLDDEFRHLLGPALSISSADRFAREVLGRSLVTLTNQPANMSGYSTLVVAVDTNNHVSEVVRTVREAALRMTRSCGAAQIQFVAGAAGGMLKQGVTPDEAERSCKVISGFEWLSEDEGWFWFGPDTENRLLSVAKKVLAIAQKQVDAEEIQNALTRSRRNHYNQPVVTG